MFKSIPKLMDFVGRRVLSKEKLADFDDVIQRLSHEILSITLASILPITLKSISSFSHSVEKKEPANQELFKIHFNEVSQVP